MSFLSPASRGSILNTGYDPIPDIYRVRDRREQMRLSGDPQRPMIGAPLPSMAWDAFFGALQGQKQAAADAGFDRFGVDLAGRGDMDGIGTFRRRNLHAAMGGLQRAMRG